MIIEQLISNYLDGDLTPEQDQELRELVAADPAARKLFDEAVLVHIAMRCEDETEVPDDLRADVFSQLDAIAQEEEHLRAATAILRQDRTRVPRRMAAVLAVLFALWVPISEGNFGFSDPINLFVDVPQTVEEQPSLTPAASAVQSGDIVANQRTSHAVEMPRQPIALDPAVQGTQNLASMPSTAGSETVSLTVCQLL